MSIAEEDPQIWQELIATYRPGHSLVGDFYTAPKVFERDIECIFLRHWLFAGHASRIPRPGDYFLYQIARESVIVVRSKGGTIHALLNVCAHRGSRICRESDGHATTLVCPYHSWCYELTGGLLSARNMPDGFNKSSCGLSKIHVRIDEDLIHLCFAEKPPDFTPVAADIAKFFRQHGWTRAKTAARETVIIRANWKLVAENFLECYHCPGTHPELAKVMSYVRAFDSARLAEERRQFATRWEAETRKLGHVTGANKRDEGVCHSVSRIPIREGYVTQSRDGKAVAPLMGELKSYDGGVTSIQFFPNNWYVANNDYGMLARFTPLAVQETEAEITWIVHRDALEGIDYKLEEIVWLWRSTMAEDREITENNQAGVNSRFYLPGPHSSDEHFDRFYRWYLEQINPTLSDIAQVPASE